jgi:protein arginine kinase
MERHIISREMASYSSDCAILVTEDEKISIMINEEDHLRLQAYGSGLSVMDTWKLVDGVDDELNITLEYDFHEKYGYLTACPTNVGTGLRASVMVHLPGLVKIQEIDQVTNAIRQIGMDVRGSFGEGSKRVGNFFQISNQITLGLSEEEILDNLVRITREVINYEEAARERLVNEERAKLEDEIWRALGAVSYNRLLDSNEALEQISKVRFGLGLGIVKNIKYSMLNEITLGVLPGHLQRRVRKNMDPEERDIERARYVREKFAGFN